ncbi:MAG: sensor histidine kinase [Actinomycetota bacterium]
MAAGPSAEQTEQDRVRDLERVHAEFLATVAHEIRDPMTSCIGFAEMLIQKGDRMTEEEREEALRTIAKTGRRLIALLEDILEVASLEGGAPTYVLRPTDLNDLVRSVIEERRPQLEGIHVSFDPGEGAMVLADEARLRRVVGNLLSNAAKFSTNGEPVRIAVRSGGREVILAVQDRGIGIDPADVPLLFQRFARVSQPGMTERIPGTGLGLYISKTIVDAHRGRIWVESEPGQGSTFFVALPAARSST